MVIMIVRDEDNVHKRNVVDMAWRSSEAFGPQEGYRRAAAREYRVGENPQPRVELEEEASVTKPRGSELRSLITGWQKLWLYDGNLSRESKYSQ